MGSSATLWLFHAEAEASCALGFAKGLPPESPTRDTGHTGPSPPPLN